MAAVAVYVVASWWLYGVGKWAAEFLGAAHEDQASLGILTAIVILGVITAASYGLRRGDRE